VREATARATGETVEVLPGEFVTEFEKRIP
jgi:hypothetical protein